MLSPKKCFAIIMMALLFTSTSYIYITNMHLYDLLDFEQWNTSYINGTNANGTLITSPMYRGGTGALGHDSVAFIAPGSYQGHFGIGASEVPLVYDADQDPITGQYGVNVNTSENYAWTQYKAINGDAAIISSVQNQTNYTRTVQTSDTFAVWFQNNTNRMVFGCRNFTESVGFGCGADFQQNHIYNNPEISNIWSAGVISGGELVHAGQSVNITGGIVELRTTDQENGTLFPMSFNATNFTFGVGDVAYIYLKYNGSAVNMLTTTNFIDITGRTSVEMFQIHQENASFLRYIDARNQNTGIGNKLVRRFYTTDRFKWGTGAMLGTPSGLNLTVTPGIFYYGVNSVDTPAFNTLTGSTIEYYYRNGTGGFDSTIQSYVNNTVYDSGTGTPTNLLPNHYKTEFMFLEISSNGGDNIAIVMGQDEYTSQASAELATVPASLPISISEMGVLIGRIVIQEGNPVIVSIASAFTQQFSPSLANQHNLLAGLDGGQTGFYGHMNTSEAYNVSKIPLKVNKSGDNLTGVFNLNQFITAPPSLASSMTPVLYITSNISSLSGVVMGNTNSSDNADFRFMLTNNLLSGYVTFMYPSSTASGTLFGRSKSTSSYIFSNRPADSPINMTVGTIASDSLIFGTSNTERLMIRGNGDIVAKTLVGATITALCIDADEKIYRSTNTTSNYLTC